MRPRTNSIQAFPGRLAKDEECVSRVSTVPASTQVLDKREPAAENGFSCLGVDCLTKEPSPGPLQGGIVGGTGVNTWAEGTGRASACPGSTGNPPTCHPHRMSWWLDQLGTFGCIAQTLGPAHLSQENSGSKEQGMAEELGWL